MGKNIHSETQETWFKIMIKRVLLPVSALLLLTAVALFGGKGPLDLIKEPLTDVHGRQVSMDTLDGKYVGIYFSAHWCPPCRAFTPKLVNFRNAHSDEFEIVFVSSDRTADAQTTYMEETGMQWPAVPWRGTSAAALKDKFQVRGIPTLVILGPNGELVSADGRMDIERYGLDAIKHWKK